MFPTGTGNGAKWFNAPQHHQHPPALPCVGLMPARFYSTSSGSDEEKSDLTDGGIVQLFLPWILPPQNEQEKSSQSMRVKVWWACSVYLCWNISRLKVLLYFPPVPPSFWPNWYTASGAYIGAIDIHYLPTRHQHSRPNTIIIEGVFREVVFARWQCLCILTLRKTKHNVRKKTLSSSESLCLQVKVSLYSSIPDAVLFTGFGW